MLSSRFIFLLLLLGLAACSMPDRVTIMNNSAAAISIEFESGKKAVIEPGRADEFSFDYFFGRATVSIDRRKQRFAWTEPPSEFKDRTRYPHTFTLILKEDGKIYVATPGEASRLPALPQPPGFPLTSS